jgi:hypothetical protein
MTEETQNELLALAKTALVFMSVNHQDRGLVFRFRDTIRKAEEEMRGCDAPDEIH